jgi:hypothetical protein
MELYPSRTIKPNPAVFCKEFPLLGMFFGNIRLPMRHLDTLFQENPPDGFLWARPAFSYPPMGV